MPSFSLRKDVVAGDFSKKMDEVFGNLTALEERHQEWESSNSEENQSLIKSDPVLEENLNQRSRLLHNNRDNDFKTPFPSYHNRKRTHNHLMSSSSSSQYNKPEFQKNPDKWTKYTLADVSDYELSDKSNTKAAMSFLAERKKLKLEEEEKNAEKIQFNKPTFRKPKVNRSNLTKIDDEEQVEKMDIASTSGLRKTAIIMPECVVGQGGSKPKRKGTVSKINLSISDDEAEAEETLTIIPKTSITLGHLDDEQEDSDS